jgi:hypothetical protein
MKRYIEIVYDNSGSMTDHIGNRTKYEIAQELFEKEILPTVAMKGDEVVLRLLRKECESEKSHAESLTIQYGTSRKAMLNRIKTINHDQSTPLFYTIYDSIEACKKETADQYLIFVLTDGDDTCGVKIEELIDQDIIDKYVKFYKVLLVQLAIDSKTSSNNLTALTSYLGGQTVVLRRNDSGSTMRNKMKKALNSSGFSLKLPLEHCYENQPGFEKSWEELESIGIDFHQALLLYNKDVLSWLPESSKQVSALELAELKFLFSLYFKSGIPDGLVLTMLAQLKKPYYYSHDCIYWDFATARWKYFIPQNIINQMENPDARNEDGVNDMKLNNHLRDRLETYDDYQVYEVEFGETIAPSYVLRPKGQGDWSIELKPGDLIKFKMR